MDKTVLNINAVKAMLEGPYMDGLFLNDKTQRRAYLVSIAKDFSPVPDWITAALNCTNDADILSMAMHCYLMDWKPEAK